MKNFGLNNFEPGMLNEYEHRWLPDFCFQKVIFRNCQKVNVPVSGRPVAIKASYASIKATFEWCISVEYKHVPIMFFDTFHSSLTFLLISMYTKYIVTMTSHCRFGIVQSNIFISILFYTQL
jgi:hypothetical protein